MNPGSEAVANFGGTRRSRAFVQLDHRLAQATDLVRGVWQGIGLGALDRDELDSLVAQFYRIKDDFRAEDWNLGGLRCFEAEAVDRHFRGCKSVLVGAAGGGREVLALDRRGFEVRGFECNTALVDWANDFLRRSGAQASIEVAAPDAAPENDRIYDGLIMGWDGYPHVVGRRTRVNLLTQLRKKVAPGGPILVSFVTVNPENRRRLKVAAFTGRRVQSVIQPKGREDVVFGDSVAIPGYLHRFTEEQIADEVAEAGLDIVQFEYRQQFPHLVATTPGKPDEPTIAN